jgi:hypothetical protein
LDEIVMVLGRQKVKPLGEIRAHRYRPEKATFSLTHIGRNDSVHEEDLDTRDATDENSQSLGFPGTLLVNTVEDDRELYEPGMLGSSEVLEDMVDKLIAFFYTSDESSLRRKPCRTRPEITDQVQMWLRIDMDTDRDREYDLPTQKIISLISIPPSEATTKWCSSRKKRILTQLRGNSGGDLLKARFWTISGLYQRPDDGGGQSGMTKEPGRRRFAFVVEATRRARHLTESRVGRYVVTGVKKESSEPCSNRSRLIAVGALIVLAVVPHAFGRVCR